MRRVLTVLTAVAVVASVFVTAEAARAKAPPCIGNKCALITFAPEACTFANTGQEPVTVSLFPDDAWRAKYPSARFPVELTLAAGEKRAQDAAQDCLDPEKNVQHWTAFAGKPTVAKKVDGLGGFFGTAKATPCTGDACKEVELRDVDDCLWLQSSSEKQVAAELTLESGAKLALPLEAADAAKAKRQAGAGEAVSPRHSPAECRKALASAEMLEKLRASGTNVVAGEADTIAAECRADTAAAEAAKKTSVTVTGYHYSIYSALSGHEYPVFRAKAMREAACVPRRDLKSWTAKLANAAE